MRREAQRRTLIATSKRWIKRQPVADLVPACEALAVRACVETVRDRALALVDSPQPLPLAIIELRKTSAAEGRGKRLKLDTELQHLRSIAQTQVPQGVLPTAVSVLPAAFAARSTSGGRTLEFRPLTNNLVKKTLTRANLNLRERLTKSWDKQLDMITQKHGPPLGLSPAKK